MTLKKTLLVLIATTAIAVSGIGFVYALPEGQAVVSGSATFDHSTADTLTITTPSDQLIVNYNSFNIDANETVRFVQPSVSSIALNRVVGVDPSVILGNLVANGRIFLVNANGVLFGAGSRVDAAALVASTLNISDSDFLNGRYNFFADGESAFISNQGAITVRNGGYVCLLSQAVSNEGTITIEAGTGSVVLAAGEEMTLNLDDAGDISVVIDEAVKSQVLDADGQPIADAVKNSGTITANGGKVLLTAKVLNNVFDHAINNSGIIQANSLVSHDGVIELVASGAPVVNSGTLQAGKVTIEAPDTSVTNIGKIVVSGTQELPDGGAVLINADTILQKGLISANSQEDGNAGAVTLVSQSSTTLDDGSTTEARALGIIGNGGRITIDSKGGQTKVNRTAVIDISSGSIVGNAGSLEVGAFDQIGFYGVLNGHAPPWGESATIRFIYHSSEVPPVIMVTDQADYPPSGTPIISGSGFLPYQEVTISISSPDGTHTTLTAVADDQGSFALTYAPETLLWGSYTVIGTDGARSAGTTFTDAPQIIMYTPVVIGHTTGTVTLRFTWSYLASAQNGYVLRWDTDSGFANADDINGPYNNYQKGNFSTLLVPNNQNPNPTYVVINTSPKTVQFETTLDLLPGGSLYWFRIAGSKENGYIISRGDVTTTGYVLLNITANDATKTYGSILNFTGTEFTHSAMFSGDDVASVTLTSPEAGDPTASISGPTYPIVPSNAVITGPRELDYIINYLDGALTITPKSASVTPNAASKVYGAVDPTLTGTLSGFLTADSVTANYTRAAGETVAGGPYTISATLSPSGVLGNYNITYNTANFTITPKAASVTPNAASKVYGAVDPTLTGVLSGFLPADLVTASYMRAAGETVGSSPYTISATLSPSGVLGNYDITYNTANFSITPASLAITADNQTKTYGNLFIFAGTEFTTSGLKNADTVTGVTLNSTGAAATASVAGSTYAVTPSNAVGAGLGNYTITYNNGALTVTPRALDITANDQTKTYGNLFTFAGTEFTTSGLKNADTVTGVTLNSTGAAATASVAGSAYSIVPSAAVGSGLGNYTITYNNGTLTINPASLTITADDDGKVYGDTYAFAGTEFTVNGLKNADSVTSVTLNSAGAPAGAGIGTYDIVPSAAVGSGLGNYSISYVNGTLTVASKLLTITANDANKVYGDVLTFAGTEFIVNGLEAGDSVTSVTLTSTGAGAAANVAGSPYAIDASSAAGTGLGDYTIVYVDGHLTITPAPLAITADNQSKTYGDPFTFTGTEFSSIGLKNAETIGSVTLNSAGAAATATVAGSTYAITPSAAIGGTFDPANYSITYHDGALTINRSNSLIITADDASKTGGDVLAFAGTEFSVSGLLNSDTVTGVTLTSTGASAGAGAGSYPIIPSNAVGTGLNNYNINYINGTLTVSALPPPPIEYFGQYDQIRYKLPYLEQLQPKQINPMDFISSTDWTGPVYFYHPLTPTDTVAFDALALDVNAYRFIEGNINIVGFDNIPPMLEAIKKRGVLPLP
ncbi:MAG: MBG domain-containing protein [Candidatus Omnitrophota bacterium]